jgi:hypothetical protein
MLERVRKLKGILAFSMLLSARDAGATHVLATSLRAGLAILRKKFRMRQIAPAHFRHTLAALNQVVFLWLYNLWYPLFRMY